MRVFTEVEFTVSEYLRLHEGNVEAALSAAVFNLLAPGTSTDHDCGVLDLCAEAAVMLRSLLVCACTAYLIWPLSASGQDFDIQRFFGTAMDAGRSGLAEKTKLVDARPASPGEIVVTVIKAEGVETKSKPAEPGDMVVRNRCEQTGNEEYLVKAATFARRYGAPVTDADQGGWRAYKPTGAPTRFVVLKADEGPYKFTAPWGETQVARPGDVIAQDPSNPADTYRIAAAAFSCTYAITQAPSSSGS